MTVRRVWFWGVVIVIGAVGLVGCEPYMSMTDPMPAQTRQAAALLPESPRYVGMVEVGTVLQQAGELTGKPLTDSLHQTDDPYLRAFLDATDMDPETDIEAAYGALVDDEALSLVLFANVTPEALDQYLDQAPADAGRAETYRDAPLFHLVVPPHASDAEDPTDTLSVAFVENGTLAVAMDADRVTTMVDRGRAEQGGLRENEDYMALVRRVGHDKTGWLAGRDVVEAALRDSTEGRESNAPSEPEQDLQVNRAGLQGALAEWSDRVLGLSEVSTLEDRAPDNVGERLGQLKGQLREQAVSVTMTDEALEGEIYLTMQNESSASSVVDVAEGAIAVMKLSGDDLDARHRDLLEEIRVERNGNIVHVRFSLERDRIRDRVREQRASVEARPDRPAIHPSALAVRR